MDECTSWSFAHARNLKWLTCLIENSAYQEVNKSGMKSAFAHFCCCTKTFFYTSGPRMSSEQPTFTWWTAWLSKECNTDGWVSPKPYDPCHLHPWPFQPHPSSHVSRQMWQWTSAPTWPCCATPKVTQNHRSLGGERTVQPFSTSTNDIALSHRAEEVYISPVSLLVYVHIHYPYTENDPGLIFSFPLSVRPVGWGWGSICLWSSQSLWQDPDPGQHHCDWTR